LEKERERAECHRHTADGFAATGEVYIEKIGPNTEPCGISLVTGMIEEELGPIVTERALFLR
jgi:hypothetical protein